MSVRVPDERLDEWVALAAKHASWPEALEAVELRDLAALVADLRAARADNQRVRERISEAIGFLADPDAANPLDSIRFARAALAPEALPCPHGRPTWRMCPHCLGVGIPRV